MSITVKFFGSVRESVGVSNVAIDSDGLSDVESVWRRATDDAAVVEDVLCAVNLEHRELDHPVSDGDEIAFFPPVTGG